MINLENLNEKSLMEIFNDAKQKIKYSNPEWNYVGESDPGITLLELFSWLKKEQHGHLSRISSVLKIKILKLLGVSPKRRNGAKTLLQISNIKNNLNIPKGTKWLANSMIFENDSETFATKSDISNIEFINPEGISVKKYFNFDDHQHFLFGKNNVFKDEKREFIINLLSEIPFKKKVNIYFDIFEKYKRNKIVNDSFIPMGEVKWEYWGTSNKNDVPHWENLNFIDNTNQFLFPGIVTIFHKGKMLQRDNGFYSLKVSLISSNYDFMPQVNNIRLNVFEVCQKDTKCENILIKRNKIHVKQNSIVFKLKTHLSIYGESLIYVKNNGSWKQLDNFNSTIDLENNFCEISVTNFDVKNFKDSDDVFLVVSYSDDIKDKMIIGNSNGFSNLSFETNFQKMSVYDEFKLMIGRKINNSYSFDIWERKDDFFGSSKFDNHFVYEEHVKLIAFGNNNHGAIPPYGKNNIRFCALSFTDGEESNLKKGTINSVRSKNNYLKSANILQISNASGGRDDEPLEQTCARLSKIFNDSHCAVTEKDYKYIVKKAQGMIIKDVSIFSEDNKLNIAIQIPETYSLPKLCKRNLVQWIEDFRLLNTDVQIIGANIINLNIRVIASINLSNDNAEEQVKKEINSFINFLNNKMGQNLIYIHLLRQIECLNYVKKIDQLELSTNNPKVSVSPNNDLIIPPNGIYHIKNLEASCIIDLENW